MNHPFNDPGLASPPSPYDDEDMYEVTLVLKTYIGSNSEDEATDIVLNTLPIQIEFGDRDAYNALPFEVEALTARFVREEDIPRP